MARASIEDRMAIEDLFVRYTTAMDSGDVDGVVGCFTEDGWLDSPIVGRRQGAEQLRAFAEHIAEFDPPARRPLSPCREQLSLRRRGRARQSAMLSARLS